MKKAKVKIKNTKFFSILILAITSFFTSQLLLSHSEKVKGISTNVSASEIIALTNLVRLKNDISSLKPNQSLEKAALLKAKDMLEKGYFDHVDNEGNGPWKFINQTEYVYQYAGENLARNYYSAEDVIDSWFQSEEHKQNMLNPLFNDIGVAVMEDKEQVVIVQLLASEIPKGLIDQLEKYQKDFIFTTPITGKKSAINPNITLTLLSIFITLATIAVFISITRLLKEQKPSFKSPNSKHWKSK